MISLPVSFVMLVWTFTTADGMLHDDEIGVLDLKNKLLLFVAHLFLLSSRLFAIVYFLVSYKWWILIILLFQSTVIAVVDILLFQQRRTVTSEVGAVAFFFSLLNWVRDDFTLYLYVDEGDEHDRNQGIAMQCLSNVLFAAENLLMISVFYFTQPSDVWYSLPVAIYVCSLSCVGVLIRLIHFSVLRKAYVPLDSEESPSQEVIFRLSRLTSATEI